MPVKIRLKRMGKKKRPFYRIVVVDSRKRRDGRVIAEIGYYNPMMEPAEVNIKEELALNYLKNGAIPTETARSLLRRKGILKKFHEWKVQLAKERKERKNK